MIQRIDPEHAETVLKALRGELKAEPEELVDGWFIGAVEKIRQVERNAAFERGPIAQGKKHVYGYWRKRR